MITLEFTEQSPIPEGKYKAVLLEVSETPPSKFRPEMNRIKFDFQIVDPGYEKKISAFCNKSAHPKSNLIRWLMALGKQVVNGKVTFGEDLRGREVMLEVEQYEKTDTTIGVKVKDIFAYRGPMHVSPGVQSARQAPQQETEAFPVQAQPRQQFAPTQQVRQQPMHPQPQQEHVEQQQFEVQGPSPRRSDVAVQQNDSPAGVRRNSFVREVPAEKIRF
jgi:hypothetical protein